MRFKLELKGVNHFMYGVIDIGSNTMRLNIYEYNNKSIRLMLSRKVTAGLAAYVDKKGNLTKKGINKAIDSLKEFKMILNHIDMEETYVFATASLRNVENSKKAVEKIEKETGFNIDLISGEEEARLGYVGASMILTLDDGLSIDIGGGSTELVLYKKGQIKRAISLPFGSLSLYNKYVEKFLPTKEEMIKIKKEVLKPLKLMNNNVFPNHTEIICGVGGSVRATHKLNNEIFSLPPDNNKIHVEDLNSILNLYQTESYEFISTLIKVAPDRLHTLLPGMVVLDTVASYYGSEVIKVSEFGVREGYLYKMINN